MRIVPLAIFVACAVFSLLVVALFAASNSSNEVSCGKSTAKVSSRDRTGAIGIIGGEFALILAIIGAVLAWKNVDDVNKWFWVFVGSIFTWLLMLTSLASLGNDIQTLKDDTKCDVPINWGSGVAFALFAWLTWTAAVVVSYRAQAGALVSSGAHKQHPPPVMREPLVEESQYRPSTVGADA